METTCREGKEASAHPTKLLRRCNLLGALGHTKLRVPRMCGVGYWNGTSASAGARRRDPAASIDEVMRHGVSARCRGAKWLALR